MFDVMVEREILSMIDEVYGDDADVIIIKSDARLRKRKATRKAEQRARNLTNAICPGLTIELGRFNKSNPVMSDNYSSKRWFDSLTTERINSRTKSLLDDYFGEDCYVL